MTGIDHIGPCLGPNQFTKDKMNSILKPINMNYEYLTWAIDGDIDVIMGGNNGRLLVQDDQELNKILRPSNLRFYSSPIFMLPLAFGELSGTWTELDDDPPDKINFKIQKPQPIKQEGLKPTRTDSTSFDQFSIPCFVNKESPVLSQTEKMVGKIYRENTRINYSPDNISNHNRILSSVSTSAPPP